MQNTDNVEFVQDNPKNKKRRMVDETNLNAELSDNEQTSETRQTFLINQHNVIAPTNNVQVFPNLDFMKQNEILHATGYMFLHFFF